MLCFKSKENAKRLLFSAHTLASIELKKQSEHCMKDLYRQTAPVFVRGTAGFAFVALYQNQIFIILAVLRRSV